MLEPNRRSVQFPSVAWGFSKCFSIFIARQWLKGMVFPALPSLSIAIHRIILLLFQPTHFFPLFLNSEKVSFFTLWGLFINGGCTSYMWFSFLHCMEIISLFNRLSNFFECLSDFGLDVLAWSGQPILLYRVGSWKTYFMSVSYLLCHFFGIFKRLWYHSIKSLSWTKPLQLFSFIAGKTGCDWLDLWWLQ